ncbi:MAG: prepilin-type cleavage/methylation domain-containing protein [Methylotenera sp.]|nr:MAG: prepilin-type cleavage/methylation domain-containing protein [Methylotenera sp.]
MTLKKQIKQKGFTLVEMAIVLVIFGLALSALLLPLRAQREQAEQAQTLNTLDNAKQALLGFAQANGRLPCPATAASQGIAAPNASGPCTVQQGFLPAATLGIQPVNSQGFAIDAWNNPIRYAVTLADNPNGVVAGLPTGYGVRNIPDFTSTLELQDIGISRTNPAPPLNVPALNPDLRVSCGQITTPECVPANLLINNAVAVVYSTGVNGALADAEVGADEVANKIGTTIFYSRTQTASGSVAGEFDDLVTWISPYVLYNAMIQAGQLH